MMRCIRLKKIRAIRAIRDEINSTNNNGRAMTLLRSYPNLEWYKIGYYNEYYGSGSSITIYTEGGFSYYFGCYGDYKEIIIEASNKLYELYLIKNNQ
jgi:hypothetical protein